MKIKNAIRSTLVFGSILYLSGCSAISGHKESMNSFNNTLLNNNCKFTEIDKKINDNNDTILWGIQGGALARNCNDYKKSIELFDKAEKKYKQEVDKDSLLSNIIETGTSVLVNNNLNEYEGNTYEKVMVNTYKALNYANLNDHKNARIEFNRALDRQRRAKEYFQAEIKKQKLKLKKEIEAQKKESHKKNQKKNQTKFIDTDKIVNNTKTQEVLYKNFNDTLNGFKSYPDFINPFTTYISGIYFMLEGDSRKARGLLKESLRMDPKNQQIRTDYNLSKKYSRSIKKQTKSKFAWIIYENGQGMINNEKRVDLPLFLVSSKVQYTGIALPKIKERSSSYTYLKVNGKKTTQICNMDNVIRTEFKKRFPQVATEAVTNMVIKTLAQYQLQRSTGILGGIAGALYQGATNKADVRSWSALPKNFQSTRIALNNKPIVIKDNHGKTIKIIKIPKNKNALIYVKSQEEGNNNIHKIIF